MILIHFKLSVKIQNKTSSKNLIVDFTGDWLNLDHPPLVPVHLGTGEEVKTVQYILSLFTKNSDCASIHGVQVYIYSRNSHTPEISLQHRKAVPLSLEL